MNLLEIYFLYLSVLQVHFQLPHSHYSVKYDMFSSTLKVRCVCHTVIEWNIDSIFWTGKIITAWCLVKL